MTTQHLTSASAGVPERGLARRGASRACLALLLLLCPFITAADTPLPAPFSKLAARYKIPESAISIVVQAVDEPEPRLTLNASLPRNPASTIKLVTTWTALDLLGPTHTWNTRVYALGPVKDGVLEGDLLIKGYGDPYLVLEDFWKLLGEIRRQGIRDIRGRLLIDDSHFATDEADPAAFDGDGLRLYNTLPNALMVNFQSFDFELDPDPASGKVGIRSVPALPNLRITNRVRPVTGACKGNAPNIIMETDWPEHIIFSGTLPFTCRHYQLPRSAMTAQTYTYGVFKSLWSQWGGTLNGTVGRATVPDGERPVVTWPSRPLAEVLRPLNKWSNNLMSRMLLYSLAETRFDPPLTRQQGTDALLQHLSRRGLDTSVLVVDNGAGLSRDTRVSARFMVDLLRLAWRSPTMPEFIASLAISGQDGTMRKRLRNRHKAGRMHLKTGSLDEVSAVAGYVHTDDGRIFAVSLLINHANARWGAGVDLQDALLSWVLNLK